MYSYKLPPHWQPLFICAWCMPPGIPGTHGICPRCMNLVLSGTYQHTTLGAEQRSINATPHPQVDSILTIQHRTRLWNTITRAGAQLANYGIEVDE
jgi:hypothetical protein